MFRNFGNIVESPWCWVRYSCVVRLSEAIDLPCSYNFKANAGDVVHSLVEVFLVELYKIVRSEVFTVLQDVQAEASTHLCLFHV